MAGEVIESRFTFVAGIPFAYSVTFLTNEDDAWGSRAAAWWLYAAVAMVRYVSAAPGARSTTPATRTWDAGGVTGVLLALEIRADRRKAEKMEV